MSRRHEVRLVADESGVSEVLSYIFAFAMSFLLLMTSLYAFTEFSESARASGARVELNDIANHVALGVQEAYMVADSRANSDDAVSADILFERRVDVPTNVQGWSYTVTLDANFVNATSPDPDQSATVSTLNLAALLPSDGICTTAYTLCTVEGSVGGSAGTITITYVYDASGPTSTISLE